MSASPPPQRPRRSAQPKPYALAEDFDCVEELSDYEEEEEEEQEEQEEENGDDDDDDDGIHKDDDDDDDSQEGLEESRGEYEEEEEEEEEEGQGLFSTAAVYHPTSKYEEPIYDMARNCYPSVWPMLTLYDIHRRPRRVPSGRWHVSSSMRAVYHALRCVICLSTLDKPKAVRECMHRFCEDCIEKSLRMGRNECPFCRVFVPSKRNLAVDSSVELLIANVLGPELRSLEHDDVQEEEEEEEDDGDNDDDNGVHFTDQDNTSPRTRRAKRRAVSSTERPPAKKSKVAPHGSLESADESDDEDDTSVNPPALFDFHLQPHKDEHFLDKLLLPYIRLTGDATVKTVIKFVQAKLPSCENKPLQITTTPGGRQRLHETTPLHMVGSLTKTLYYRLASVKQRSSHHHHRG